MGDWSEDLEEPVYFQALLDVVALVEGKVEVREILAGGEGARGTWLWCPGSCATRPTGAPGTWGTDLSPARR